MNASRREFIGAAITRNRSRIMSAATVAAMAAMPILAAEFPHGEEWGRRFAVPDGFTFTRKAEKVDSREMDGFTLETWRQANGPASFQRVLVAAPKGAKGKLPAVVVPSDAPEAMFGGSPEMGVSFAADLAKRGYVAFASDCRESGKDSPAWSGMGRLAHNARLLVDMAEGDARVDKDRIGIIGYGAGAKAAYCAGLLDKRVKAVVECDMGVGLDHVSWSEARFWGDGVKEMLKAGLSNEDLLVQSGGKPLMFFAGQNDAESYMSAFKNRKNCPDVVRRRYYRNRSSDALDRIGINEAYAFLDEYVKCERGPLKAYQGGRVRLFDKGWKVEGKISRCVRIPGMAVAPDGSILVVFDARLWNAGDLCWCQPTRTAVMRSTDCGRTWSEPKFVWDFPWNEKERFSASDPSLVVDHVAKKVFCFANVMEFVRGRNVYRFFVWESSDNGVTWSEPREISEDIRWPGIEIGKHLSFITSGHGIQAGDGTLMHVIVAQRFGVNIFGSEDHGKTWKCIGNPTNGAADESKVEVLADGTWMINSRYSWCRQIHRSTDRGKTWNTVQDMNLPDSRTNAGTVTTRLKDGREVLLFCNSSRAVRPRMHITLRASLDGGYNWNRGVLIDPGHCEYSDCAVMPDGRVAVVYEAEGERAIDFVAVPLDEVLAQ